MRELKRKFRFSAVLLLVAVFLVNSRAASADVKISGFSDMNLGTWTGSGSRQGENNLCVYNSNGTGYFITGKGSGPLDAFTLSQTDPAGEIPYTLEFRGNASYVEIPNPGVAHSFNGANQVDENCLISGNNAAFRITVSAESMGSVPAGFYNGTLWILLEPQ